MEYSEYNAEQFKRVSMQYRQLAGERKTSGLDTSEFKKIRFESWGDYLDYVSKEPAPNKGGFRQSHDNNPSFRGVENFSEAMKLATYGWADGAASAEKFAAPLVNKISHLIVKDNLRYDTTGMGYDIDKVMTGEPECWMTFEQEITEGDGNKVLQIVFNNTASAAIRRETIQKKGAAIAALVQLLELGGYRVELWSMSMSVTGYKGTYPGFECRVQIKKADQELDMPQVIYALAHPSALRCLGFAAAEVTPKVMDSIGSGYGMVTECADADKGDIYIGGSMLGEPQWEDDEMTEGWVKSVLKAQGITLEQ